MNKLVQYSVSLSLFWVISSGLGGFALDSKGADSGKALTLEVTRESDNSIVVRFTRPGANVVEDGGLVAVDNEPARGKTLLEVESSLLGPIDSTLKLGFLSSDGKCQTQVLRRFSQFRPDSSLGPIPLSKQLLIADEAALKSMLDVDVEYPPSAIGANRDLAAKAACWRNFQGVGQAIEPRRELIIGAAADAAFYCLEMGDLPGADFFLNQLMENLGDGASFWQYLRGCRKPFLTLLIDSGRLDVAERLCDIAIERCNREEQEQGRSTSSQSMNGLRWSVYKLYGRLLCAKGSRQLKDVADRMFADMDSQRELDDDDVRLIASWYTNLGEFQHAEACYKRVISSEECCIDPSEVNICSLSSYAKDCLELAAIQEQGGDMVAAVNSLQKAIDYYAKAVTSQQALDFERSAAVNPKLSELSAAMAEMKLKQGQLSQSIQSAQKALNLLAEAHVADGPLRKKVEITLAKGYALAGDLARARALAKAYDRRPLQSESIKFSISKEYELLRTAYCSLDSGDEGACQLALDGLLKSYKWRGAGSEGLKEQRLNLYVSLLQFARHLSDRGKFVQSDELLKELLGCGPILQEDPGVTVWINVEKIINQSRRRQKVDWTLVSSNPLLAGIPEAEKYRLLAVEYLGANEVGRAKILIEKSATCAGADVLERSLVMLDDACINLKLHKREEIFAQVAQSIEMVRVNKSYEDIEKRLTFARLYRIKLATFGKLCAETNLALQAIPVLNKAVAELPLGAAGLSSSPTETKYDRAVVRCEGQLMANLGQCLVLTGRFDEAKSVLSLAEKPFGPYGYPFDLLQSLAICYEKLGQDNEKSKYYRLLAGRIEQRRESAYSALQNYYESKAQPGNVATEKSSVADLQVELNTLCLGDWTNCVGPCCFGLELPNDQEVKKQLQLAVSYLKQARSKHRQDNAALAVKINTIFLELAMKYAPQARSKSLISLACAEIENDMIEQGLVHARDGVETMSCSVIDLLGDSTFDRLLGSLDKTGHMHEAEELLALRRTRHAAVFGERSAVFLSDMASEVLLFVRHCNSAGAMQSLDRLCTVSARVQENSTYTDQISPLNMIVEQLGGKLSKFRLGATARLKTWDSNSNEVMALRIAILEKILAVQKRTLAEDDERIANTEVAMGEVYQEMHKTNLSVECFEKALKIISYYAPGGFRAQDIDKCIALASGKTDDSKVASVEKKIEVGKVESTLTPISWTDIELEIDSLSADKKIGYVASLYERARKLAPYSLRSESLLDALVQLSEKQGQRDSLITYLCDRIEILERRDEGESSGRRRPPYSVQRLELYLKLVKALMSAGKTEQAKSYAKRAGEFVPSVWSKRELPLLSEIQEAVHALDRQKVQSDCN